MDQSPAEVRVFLEKMLVDGGMADVVPEVKEQMIDDLMTRLQSCVFAAVLAKLPEQDLPAFNELADRNAPQDDVQRFLVEHVPDIDAITGQAMLDFRAIYVKEPTPA